MAGPEGWGGMRWLAWGAACVVLVAAVSAGVLVANRDRPGRAVVSAAGDRSGTVGVTSTVTIPLPVSSSTPPSTVATTTTLPKAAVDVLNAIGSTTTTRRQATTTTTTPPAPATTLPTTTTIARFKVTVRNNHPNAVELLVNGQPFPLTPAQEQSDVDLPLSSRGDVVQARVLGQDCHATDSGVIFRAGGSYDITILPGETTCNGGATRPKLEIKSR